MNRYVEWIEEERDLQVSYLAKTHERVRSDETSRSELVSALHSIRSRSQDVIKSASKFRFANNEWQKTLYGWDCIAPKCKKIFTVAKLLNCPTYFYRDLLSVAFRYGSPTYYHHLIETHKYMIDVYDDHLALLDKGRCSRKSIYNIVTRATVERFLDIHSRSEQLKIEISNRAEREASME